MAKNVLVTGGTGLVGTNLLKALTQSTDTIYAIKRAARTIPADLRHLPIKWIDADLLDNDAMYRAIECMQQVYHVAACISFQPQRRAEMFHVNVQGTAHVVDACLEHKVEKLVHISSIAAIGRTKDNSLITEKTPWLSDDLNSHYGISKHEGEMEVWRGINEGLNAIILNPSVILGSGNWFEGSTALFRQVYKGLKFYPLGKTGFVDVLDVVRAMQAAMASPISGERYLVTGENVGFKDMLSMMADSMGVKRPTIPTYDWMKNLYSIMDTISSRISGHVPVATREALLSVNLIYEYDDSKIKDQLHFAFTPIPDVIKRIAQELKVQYSLK